MVSVMRGPHPTPAPARPWPAGRPALDRGPCSARRGGRTGGLRIVGIHAPGASLTGRRRSLPGSHARAAWLTDGTGDSIERGPRAERVGASAAERSGPSRPLACTRRIADRGPIPPTAHPGPIPPTAHPGLIPRRSRAGRRSAEPRHRRRRSENRPEPRPPRAGHPGPRATTHRLARSDAGGSRTA